MKLEYIILYLGILNITVPSFFLYPYLCKPSPTALPLRGGAAWARAAWTGALQCPTESPLRGWATWAGALRCPVGPLYPIGRRWGGATGSVDVVDSEWNGDTTFATCLRNLVSGPSNLGRGKAAVNGSYPILKGV